MRTIKSSMRLTSVTLKLIKTPLTIFGQRVLFARFIFKAKYPNLVRDEMKKKKKKNPKKNERP